MCLVKIYERKKREGKKERKKERKKDIIIFSGLGQSCFASSTSSGTSSA